MPKENLILKRRLILQSFLPLYIMLFIKYFDFGIFCILRSLADSDAFQSGRCAEHNGRPETLAIINKFLGWITTV